MNLGHSLTESIPNGQGEAKFSTGTCSLRYCVWEHCPLMHRLMAWVQTQKNTRMANRSRSYSNWTPIHANWEGGPSDDMALWQFCRFPNRETIPRWNRPQAFGFNPEFQEPGRNVATDPMTLHAFAEIWFHDATCSRPKASSWWAHCPEHLWRSKMSYFNRKMRLLVYSVLE